MSREYARLRIDISGDDEFRALSRDAQWLYMRLLIAPTLSYAGIADWRQGRLAAIANNTTIEDINKAADELVRGLYIVVDRASEEVLVRSFIKHDGIMRNSKMAVAMATAYADIASTTLRGVVVHQLKRLHDKEPDLAGWAAPRAKALLERPSVDPTGLPQPVQMPDQKADGCPIGSGIGSGIGSPIGSGITQVDRYPGVSPAPTPAPAPTTSYEVVQQLKDAREPAAVFEPTPPTLAQQWRTDGWAEVRAVIPANYPQATKTALAIACSQLRVAGTSHEDVCAGLVKWKAKDKAGPGLLPYLVTDAIKERENAANPQSNLAKGDQKVFGWDTELQKLKTGNNNGMRELN